MSKHQSIIDFVVFWCEGQAIYKSFQKYLNRLSTYKANVSDINEYIKWFNTSGTSSQNSHILTFHNSLDSTIIIMNARTGPNPWQQKEWKISAYVKNTPMYIST